MVVGNNKVKSGVFSRGVVGPKAAIELGAKIRKLCFFEISSA
jgi:hypothetical protein